MKGNLIMKHWIKDWIFPILEGLILFFIINFFFSIIRVSGISMYPTLQNREFVIMSKRVPIYRDDVIVFNAYGVDKNNPTVRKGTKYTKRIIGLPGDKIEYTNNGNLYINSKYTSQNYISRSQRTSGTLTLLLPEAKGVKIGANKTFTVPKNCYFVLGDNRKVSNDSRYYGFVPKNKILGRVYTFPWQEKIKM